MYADPGGMPGKAVPSGTGEAGRTGRTSGTSETSGESGESGDSEAGGKQRQTGQARVSGGSFAAEGVPVSAFPAKPLVADCLAGFGGGAIFSSPASGVIGALMSMLILPKYFRYC